MQLTNSFYFDKTLTTTGIGSKAREVMAAFPDRRINLKSHLGTLRTFLANAKRCLTEQPWCAHPQGKAHYNAAVYYGLGHMTYKKQLTVFRWLEDVGLIEVHRGFQGKKKSYYTRWKPTDLLIGFLSGVQKQETKSARLVQCRKTTKRWNGSHCTKVKVLQVPRSEDMATIETLETAVSQINTVQSKFVWSVPMSILLAYQSYLVSKKHDGTAGAVPLAEGSSSTTSFSNLKKEEGERRREEGEKRRSVTSPSRNHCLDATQGSLQKGFPTPDSLSLFWDTEFSAPDHRDSSRNHFVNKLIRQNGTLPPMSYIRVFHDRSLDSGGRFYTAAQQLPRALRPFLLCDGKQTVTLDLSCLHPTMLYIQEHQDLPEDVYALLDHLSRPDAKLVVLVLINAQSQQSAIASIRDKQNKGVLSTTLDPNEILLGAEEALPVIARYFYSDIGKHLMNLDSQIASDILEAFSSRNLPIENLHDGFVVQSEQQTLLHNEITKAFKRVLTTPIEPKIKKETSNPWAENHDSRKKTTFVQSADRRNTTTSSQTNTSVNIAQEQEEVSMQNMITVSSAIMESREITNVQKPTKTNHDIFCFSDQ